jgi:hypothetical protein
VGDLIHEPGVHERVPLDEPVLLLARGAGLSVNPLQPSGWKPSVISGPAEEIADSLRTFRQAGFTQVDIMLGPGTIEAFEAMAPVVELLRAD